MSGPKGSERFTHQMTEKYGPGFRASAKWIEHVNIWGTGGLAGYESSGHPTPLDLLVEPSQQGPTLEVE